MAKLLNLAGLASKGINYSRAHLLRKEKAGEFPPRLRLGDTTIRWDEDEVDAWIEEKKKARRPIGPAPIPLRKRNA